MPVALFCHWLARKALSRWYSYSEPWYFMVPDLILVSMTAPVDRLYSAE